MDLAVGDTVSVDKASGVNAAGALGLVVERYTLQGRPGWTILFADGRADGFSPSDCALFGVRRVGHVAALAPYRFASIMRLSMDFQSGAFVAAFGVSPVDGEPQA